MANIVEMHNVSIVKEDRVILRDIDLRISSGERIAILGPNGSGKSSLIKTMIGEFWHDASVEGSYVKIRGTDKWNLFDVRKAFGIVSGDLQFDFRRNMKVFDAVLSGFFGSVGTNRSQNIDKEMEEMAFRALASVEAMHLAQRDISSLSMGEARRVMIARSLVNDPEALILDEPLSSLDLTGKHIVRQAMRSLVQSGRTIVLVTHDPSDLIPEIDRIIMIKDGGIIRDGGSELLTQENLSELYGVPIHLLKKDGRYCAWS